MQKIPVTRWMQRELSQTNLCPKKKNTGKRLGLYKHRESSIRTGAGREALVEGRWKQYSKNLRSGRTGCRSAANDSFPPSLLPVLYNWRSTIVLPLFLMISICWEMTNSETSISVLALFLIFKAWYYWFKKMYPCIILYVSVSVSNILGSLHICYKSCLTGNSVK